MNIKRAYLKILISLLTAKLLLLGIGYVGDYFYLQKRKAEIEQELKDYASKTLDEMEKELKENK